MAHYEIAALFAVAFATCVPCLVHGLDHHMICKSVESVFDGENSRPVSQSRRTLQGPAGKRGIKGEKGSPGLFDHRILENMIAERVSAATEGMTLQIEQLQEEVREINSTTFMTEKKNTKVLQDQIEALQEQIRQANSSRQSSETAGTEVTCDDGVVYRRKCYFAILQDVRFDDKETICGARGGRAGSILNTDHLDLIENYVRTKIADSRTSTWIWLGMTFDHSRKTLTTGDGATFHSTSVRWYPGYPKSGNNTKLLIHVDADESKVRQGVYNKELSGSTSVPGVLCEK